MRETTEHEAFKARDIASIERRKKCYIRMNAFFARSRSRQKFDWNKKREYYLLYPLIDDEKSLRELLSRLDFSLPAKKDAYVHIPVSDTLLKILETEALESKYRFITDAQMKARMKSDFILVHDASSLSRLSILRLGYKSEIIDNTFFSDKEAESLRKLFFFTFDVEEKRVYHELSRKNYLTMLEKNRSKKTAYCFTSGPSFDDYRNIKIEAESLKVICNSIVRNRDFLEYIEGPDIITFADPVFHFGPSEYAMMFREDVLALVKRYDSYLVVPYYNVPLLLAHYPQLEDRIIGMPEGKTMNFPDKDGFFVKGSANILTLYMLPVASAVSTQVNIIGADGRKKDEKYFWKHSSSVQYDDQMESVFRAHPSFFRDRSYEDYYETHCMYMEELLSHGESKGNTYTSLTPSYIPALITRAIKK